MSEKITISKSFSNIFCQENKYFGEWFIEPDQSLLNFLENLKKENKFFTQLQNLYLYLESLEILKKQAEPKDFSISKLVNISLAELKSRDTWYCCVLLLLVSLIDQRTKKEFNEDGNLKSMKKRFQIVMNCLPEDYKQDMLNHYRGQNKFKNFNEIISNLYATRNFFAHDLEVPLKSIPQDKMLAFDDEKVGLSHLNMSHGRIFLTITIALLNYLGYSKKIHIKSNKKFHNFTDMLRST